MLLRAVGESATLTAVLLLADLARYSDALPYLAMAQEVARETMTRGRPPTKAAAARRLWTEVVAVTPTSAHSSPSR